MDKNFKKPYPSLLRETLYNIDRLFTLYAKSVGLNFITMLILQLLYDSQDVYTQKAVCEKLALPKQLVNSVIKSFWEQNFVELKEAKDRRNKDIILTSKGKEYARSVLKPLEDAESAAWESFSKEELTAFTETMEKYAKAFEIALGKQLIHKNLLKNSL